MFLGLVRIRITPCGGDDGPLLYLSGKVTRTTRTTQKIGGTVKFSVKRAKGATAHKLEITPRKWAERSVVSLAVAADRSWVIGFQRFAKGNWPANLTGDKLVTELERMAQNVFVYGGATEMPPTVTEVGITDSDTAEEQLAKLRAAGILQ